MKKNITDYLKASEKPKEIDWEQRRYEIAKDMLSAMYEQDDYAASCDIKTTVNGAVLYADALIEELKKTSK